jgi:predicted phage terminase large subunit-like protein
MKFGQAVAPDFGDTFGPVPHINLICNKLELVFAGKIKRLIINIPPRHGKSMIASWLFPAWCYGLNPRSKFILSSYGSDLSEENSGKVRKIVGTPAFKKIFPGISMGDLNRLGHWETNHGGKMFATNTGGPATGFGAGGSNPWFEGAIIIDDPTKSLDAAKSAAARSSAIDYFTGTLENRRNAPDTPIIIIMQRQHPTDLCGYLHKTGFLGPWDVLKLKGLQDDGTALWPQKKSAEDWVSLRETDPFTFYSQSQQEPIMPGGNLCQTEWWARWTKDELKKVVGGFITVDTSYGKNKKADYTVFQLWLYGSNGLFLYDQMRGKWKTPDIIEKLEQFWIHYRPTAINDLPIGPIYIEDKASGTSVAQDLETKGVPVEYWQPYADKVRRFKDSLPGVKGGRTMIPADDYMPERPIFYSGEITNFVPAFVDEHAEFSEDDSHDYDDQCDCQSMADSIYRGMYGGMRA